MDRSPLAAAALMRQFNTLHGFNCSGVTDGYAVGLISRPGDEDVAKDLARSIMERAGLRDGDVVTVDDFIGRDYVKVPLARRSIIPKVVDALVDLGYSVCLQTKLAPVYRPGECGRFSIAESERLAIESARKLLSMIPRYYDRDDCRADERLWQTAEGKALARQIRGGDEPISEPLVLLPVPPEFGGDDPAIDWPPVPAAAGEPAPAMAPLPAAAVPVPRPAEKKRAAPGQDKEEDEDSLCMVCLSAPADTIAMPCGCVVVCRLCSPKLSETPDKRTCVHCRRPITSVVYPDRDVSV